MNNINMVMPSNTSAMDLEDAKQSLDAMHELSSIMKCGVDRSSLSILISLLEDGCKPEQLAAIVTEIARRKSDPK